MTTSISTVAGETYALTVRRDRGPNQTYVGRYLGASGGWLFFALAGGLRLKVDEWSLTRADVTERAA